MSVVIIIIAFILAGDGYRTTFNGWPGAAVAAAHYAALVALVWAAAWLSVQP